MALLSVISKYLLLQMKVDVVKHVVNEKPAVLHRARRRARTSWRMLCTYNYNDIQWECSEHLSTP